MPAIDSVGFRDPESESSKANNGRITRQLESEIMLDSGAVQLLLVVRHLLRNFCSNHERNVTSNTDVRLNEQRQAERNE